MCGKVLTFLTVHIGFKVLTVLTDVKFLTVLKAVIVLTVLTAFVEFHLISTYHSKGVIIKSYWRNATVKRRGGTRLTFALR